MSVAMSVPPFVDSPSPTAAELWLSAWENSADCAYCRDTAGRILAANVSFARRFGRASVIDTHVAEFVHIDDLATVLSTHADLARPPHRANSVHRWQTPQGVRWFDWEETALSDGAGHITAIRAIG